MNMTATPATTEGTETMDTTYTMTDDETSAPVTMLPLWRLGLIADDAKTVERFVKRTRKWFAHVDAHRDSADGFNLRLMPSKTAKWRAYEAASRIERALTEAGWAMSHATTLETLTVTALYGKLYLTSIAAEQARAELAEVA